MNNYSKIYWLTRLDNIGFLFGMLTFLACATLLIYFIIKIVECNKKDDRKDFDNAHGSIKRLALWVLIPSLLICTFLPSKNDMILIYAGGKTMDFVQKDSSLNKIPYQTTKIISDYLDNLLKNKQNGKNK